jgi:hypothetical protein
MDTPCTGHDKLEKLSPKLSLGKYYFVPRNKNVLKFELRWMSEKKLI